MAGLVVEWQRVMPIHYGRVVVDAGCRVDLFAQHALIVEITSVRAFAPVHDAQVLTYLRIASLEVV